MVHELAEQIGDLKHESQGTAKNRFIMVTKLILAEPDSSVKSKTNAQVIEINQSLPILMAEHAAYACMDKAQR